MIYFQRELLLAFDEALSWCDRETLIDFLDAQSGQVKVQLWRLIEHRIEILIDKVIGPLEQGDPDLIVCHKRQIEILLGEGFISSQIREDIFNYAVEEGQDWLIEIISAVYARNNRALPFARQGGSYAKV